METNLKQIAQREATALAPESVAPEECSTVCYHPECACRERLFAGCSLPLATVNITSERRNVKGDER